MSKKILRPETLLSMYLNQLSVSVKLPQCIADSQQDKIKLCIRCQYDVLSFIETLKLFSLVLKPVFCS